MREMEPSGDSSIDILEVFEELKRPPLNLLPKERKLRESGIDNFKSGVLFRRTIFFDPKYRHLPVNDLRYALLHEEGHKKKKKYTTLVLEIDVFVILLSSFLISYSPINQKIQLAITYGLLPVYIFLLLSSLRIFGGAIQKDEYFADKYSAMILKQSFGVRRPSLIVESTLSKITSSRNKDALSYRLGVLFFGGLHPSDEERVGAIERTVDEQSDTE